MLLRTRAKTSHDGNPGMNDASGPYVTKPLLRIEDEALLRGRGRFMADAPLPREVHGVFVRSPHAHARIRGFDVAAAQGADGVLAVLTSADMKAAGVGTIHAHFPMVGRGGGKLIDPVRPALADDRAMHVGQPVALVVATTAALAQDAAELVSIDYEALPAVIDGRAAVAAGICRTHSAAPPLPPGQSRASHRAARMAARTPTRR